MQPYDYSQNDARWRDEHLGFSNTWYIGNHNGDNSHSGGCAITSAAMIASALGHNINPAQINAAMKERALINADGDFTRDDFLHVLFPDILYIESKFWGQNELAPFDYFNIINDPYTEILVMIDCRPDPGVQQHWLRVRGFDGNGDILVVDPWDGKRKGLSAYARRDNKTVQQIIWKAVRLGKQRPAPPEPAKPVAIPLPAAPAPKPAAPPAPSITTPTPQATETTAPSPTPDRQTDGNHAESKPVATPFRPGEIIVMSQNKEALSKFAWFILRMLARVFFPGVFNK